ncbi:MAG: hypothetical protein J6H18_00150, partial [Lachnospiraceae bacterium]|nr:hypothetical protein [Lachnospiraceae bacterium]
GTGLFAGLSIKGAAWIGAAVLTVGSAVGVAVATRDNSETVSPSIESQAEMRDNLERLLALQQGPVIESGESLKLLNPSAYPELQKALEGVVLRTESSMERDSIRYYLRRCDEQLVSILILGNVIGGGTERSLQTWNLLPESGKTLTFSDATNEEQRDLKLVAQEWKRIHGNEKAPLLEGLQNKSDVRFSVGPDGFYFPASTLSGLQEAVLPFSEYPGLLREELQLREESYWEEIPFSFFHRQGYQLEKRLDGERILSLVVESRKDREFPLIHIEMKLESGEILWKSEEEAKTSSVYPQSYIRFYYARIKQGQEYLMISENLAQKGERSLRILKLEETEGVHWGTYPITVENRRGCIIGTLKGFLAADSQGEDRLLEFQEDGRLRSLSGRPLK